MPIDTTNLAGTSIMQAAAGANHSLVLTGDGAVYSFGAGSDGQTGLGITPFGTSIATPIDTTNMLGTTIAQVAAGNALSLLLTDNGNVFSFGYNGNGRTGLGFEAFTATSIAMPIDETNLVDKTITQVAAGNEHGLLLASDGTVFSFGNNSVGRTGLNTDFGNTSIATPIDMTNLAGKTITQIAAGRLHSLLLADDGTVYAFGSSSFGQAGLGPILGTTIAMPIDTTNLAGKTITQVAAGRRYSLLLADDGSVLSFGWNANGATGLGTDAGVATIATPIDMTNLAGLRVTSISAGANHSLVIAVPEPGSATLLLLSALPLVTMQRPRRRSLILST